MKKIFLLCIIFLAFLIESRVSILGAAPNLTAAIVYCYGLKNGEARGMLFGSLIGLFSDSLSGGIIGPNLLGKGLVGFFSAFMSGSFFRWTPVLGMLGLSALTVLDGAAVFISKTIFEHVPTDIPDAVAIIFVSATINSLFGIFLRPRNEQ